MFRQFLAVGLAVLCPLAFAKQPELPSPVAHELPVEIVLDQTELAVDVPHTASQMGMQFGLIGALIGSGIQNSQTKRAEEAVIPLRNALLDYPFRQHLEEAIRTKLASDGISPEPQVAMMKLPWTVADTERDTAAMPARAMVIRPRFAMDNGFNRLSVLLQVSIEDRVVKSNGKVKSRVAFNRNYAFQSTLPSPGAQPVEEWSRMGAARLAEIIDMGIQHAVDMVVYDFSAEGRAQWTGKYHKQRTQLNGMQYAGQELRRGEDWVWVRTGNKVLQALDGFRPLAVDSKGLEHATIADAGIIDVSVSHEDDSTSIPATDAVADPMNGDDVLLPLP